MSNTVLHVTNGDGAADLIIASSINGTVLPWRDPMHHGPFPHSDMPQSVSSVRAGYLAGDTHSLEQTLAEFARRDATLAAAHDYQATVLWFEHDLLDQLQLLQLLDHFYRTDKQPEKLELICIDRFDGIDHFRGLGQLTSPQLTSLYPNRQAVSPAQLQQAHELWVAFCAADPRHLVDLVNTLDHTLPFMRRALFRHFEEYPWVSDGLSRTERQMLQLLDRGEQTAGQLFIDNMNFEDALYIGDWTSFATIDRLARSATPLIEGSTGAYQPWDVSDAKAYAQQSLRLSSAGRQVLSGELHARELIDRDCWLGGVNVSSRGNYWQWNDRVGGLEL